MTMTASDMARLRWACTTEAERKAISAKGASKGGRAAWKGMTKAERSAENKRRAAKRRKTS